MAKIVLVRHGQASAGTDNYDRLSPLGRHQSALLGEHWKRIGFKAEYVHAGTLERQQDTAIITLDSAGITLPLHTLPALNEYDHTVIDRLFASGKTSDMPENLQFSDYCEIMARWRDATPQILDGAESWQQFEQRGWTAIRQAASNLGPRETAVFFTSGGVIATVMKQCLQLDFDKAMNKIWHLYNASVSTIKLEAGRTILLDYNTRSHLEQTDDLKLLTFI